MHTTDVPLSSEERLREIVAILAAGLLRLRPPPSHPHVPRGGEDSQAGGT